MSCAPRSDKMIFFTNRKNREKFLKSKLFLLVSFSFFLLLTFSGFAQSRNQVLPISWKNPENASAKTTKNPDVSFSEKTFPTKPSKDLLPRVLVNLDSLRDKIYILTHHHPQVMEIFDLFAQTLKKVFMDKKIAEEDLQKIQDALLFAAWEQEKDENHSDEKDSSFLIRPISVANSLLSIGSIYDREIIIAAILHTFPNKSDSLLEEIGSSFGKDVASYIQEMAPDEKPFLNEKTIGARQMELANQLFYVQSLLKNPPKGNQEKEQNLQTLENSLTQAKNLPASSALGTKALQKALESSIKSFTQLLDKNAHSQKTKGKNF
jgi:hypothetical protein